jgi:hypothetical protein
METLVIDAGTTMVGIYAVEAGTYVPYTMSEIIAVAVPRIAAAREVITYNGRRYDLLELGRLAGMSCNLPLTGYIPIWRLFVGVTESTENAF